MGQGEAVVGRSVRTAAAGVRDLAAEAARVGAGAAARAVEIADRKLAEGADEFADVRRKAAKDLDKSTRSSRREVVSHSVAARDEVLARAAKLRDPGRKAADAVAAVAAARGESPRRRRKAVAAARKDLTAALSEAKSAARGQQARRSRWPWLLGAGVVVAAVAAVLRAKRRNPLTEPEPRVTPVTPAAPAAPAATVADEAAVRPKGNGTAVRPEGKTPESGKAPAPEKAKTPGTSQNPEKGKTPGAAKSPENSKK